MSRRDWVEAGMPADHPALGGVEGEWLPAHFGVAHPDEEAEYRPSPVTADLPPVVFAEIGKQIGARDADEVRAWIEEQNDRVREANQMLFEHSGRLRELWDAGDEEGADALIQQLIDEGMGADATH